MNPKLEAIAKKAAEDLIALVKESEDKILTAWNSVEEEAQDNDAPPKFKLGLAITLDLDADKMETALTYGIRHKLTAQSEIPDPNQTKLPLSPEDEEAHIVIHKGVKALKRAQKN